MNKEIIEIENLKCGGCKASVEKGVKKIGSVTAVEVDLDTSTVSVSHDGTLKRQILLDTLGNMGYPEKGTGTTIQKVKSYVSCAVGRLETM